MPGHGDLASLLYRHFGVAGTLNLVAHERDYVYLVESRDQRFVARLSRPEESAASIRLQNRALRVMSRCDSGVSVPAILESNRGQRVVHFSRQGLSWRLRLLTYVPGVPAARRLRSDDELFAIGATLADIDHALSGIDRHRRSCALVWNLESAPCLRNFVSLVPEAHHGRLLAAALTELERDVLPVFHRLPRQAIHNDFSPNNVLYRQLSDVLPSGVIDFADVTVAPRMVDLGVAIARFTHPSVLACNASAIVAGYQSRIRLTSHEIAALFYVIKARLAMRVLIRYGRAANDASMSAKDLEAVRESLALLDSLTRLGPSKFAQALMPGRG